MIVENCPFRRDPRVRREAKALLKAGYQVSVISPSWPFRAWRELVDGAKVYQFPLAPVPGVPVGYLFEYTYAMLAIAILTAIIFFADGFDIIQIANPPDCIILVVAIYKMFGKLIIYDQHDICPELYQARFRERSESVSNILFFLEKLSYRLADQVIVTNESYRQIATKRGGLDPSKITVVRNGPDLENLKTVAIEPTLRSKSRNIILYAGITGSQDGVDFLCRALHSLRYKLGREDFYCAILGDGDALQEIKSLVHELQLDEFIWFAGWVIDPALYASYLSTADICAAPEPSNNYNDRSTFIKVMEYMCRAKPVVAFDLPETRFSAGPAAIYACPNNEADFAIHIAKLMDDPALRKSMGESGYQRICSELAWDYSVPNLLGAYQKLTNPQQPTPAITGSDPTTTPASVHETTEIHTKWKERESIWR